MPNSQSATETRALALLGQGLSPSVVAAALGVTDARISQMLAEDEFAKQVQELRFNHLQQSTEIDGEYNDIESKLLEKLKKSLPLIHKPRDVLTAISVINGAKRRGQTAPDTASMAQRVVNLSLPLTVQQKFVTNINNQITEIRDGSSGKAQTLVTAQSGSLDRLVAEQKQQREQREQEHASQELNQLPGPEPAREGSSKGSGSKGQITVEDLL